MMALQGMIAEKKRQKSWYDRQIEFKEEDCLHASNMVFLYDANIFKRKLKFATIGLYRVAEVTPQGTVLLESLDEKHESLISIQEECGNIKDHSLWKLLKHREPRRKNKKC